MPDSEPSKRKDRNDDTSAWENKLEGANFQWVGETIALMFQIAEQEAKEQDGYHVYKAEYLEALGRFIESPCLETAIALLEAVPSLWSVFEQSKDPLLQPNVPPLEATTSEIDNARQMPVIDYGVVSIKLGLFTVLLRRYQHTYEASYAVSMAYCVTHRIFFDPIEQRTLETFAEGHTDAIDIEISNVFTDEQLSEPVLVAYAALMIALGWQTRDPFNPIASKLTQRATNNNVIVPNIVRIWGSEAIAKFFQFAQEFLVDCLNA
jgi:hypothetical protein